MQSEKFGLENSDRVSSCQDFAARTKTVVQANATIAALLIASIFTSLRVLWIGISQGIRGAASPL